MSGESTISSVLQTEHREVEKLLDRFEQALGEERVDAPPFQEAARILHRHIYLEEELLFPEVEARGLIGPTQVMTLEHGQIWQLLESILDGIRSGAEPERIQDTFRALRGVLEGHNMKEEQVLYPTADQFLAGPEHGGIVRRLTEAIAPEGWTCRARRSG